MVQTNKLHQTLARQVILGSGINSLLVSIFSWDLLTITIYKKHCQPYSLRKSAYNHIYLGWMVVYVHSVLDILKSGKFFADIEFSSFF